MILNPVLFVSLFNTLARKSFQLTILIFASLLIAACSGGSNDSAEKPINSETMFLGTPATQPAVIPPSSIPTQVTFLSMVTGTAHPPDVLILDEVDGDGVTLTAGVALLYDNGKLADQKRGDRIYTGTLNIGSVDAAEKNYRVSTVFNGKAIRSNRMNFWVSGCPATSRPSDPAQLIYDSASNSQIFANEVMIRTRVGVPPDLNIINLIAAQANGHVVGCIPAFRQYLLEINNPNTPADAAGVYSAITTLGAHPDIDTVFPNGRSLAVPGSPLTSSLLCNGVVNSQCQWYLDRIRAPQAWQLAGGGDPQMAVGVIDFGVDCALNGLPCDATLFNQDPIDHGTGVAGLIASPDNATGMVGAAYNTQLYPYSFLGGTGSQYKMNELITATLSQADVRIINISAGTATDFGGQVKAAVCNAISSGRLVVAAAGNPTGADAQSCQLTNVFPARFNSIGEQCDNGADLHGGLIVVGATDINNGLASWSDGNQAHCSNQSYVNLYAPGKDIITLSTVSGYTTKSGTSYAAPLVSGAAAVLWSANPGFTATQIHDQLINSAGRLGLNSSVPRLQTSDNRLDGKPLLDMYRAVGGVDQIIVPDTTPDPFTLSAVTDAPLDTDVSSQSIIIDGIDSPTPISISGGFYSINKGPFTNAAGSVQKGDSITAQLHTSSLTTTTSTANVTIGGLSQAFSVTTRAPITTPAGLSFPKVTDASNGTTVVSDPQLITGIDPNTVISISGGEYSLDGGSYTSATGTINPGQTVQVRVTSPPDFASSSEAVLTIGGVSSSFQVTTPVADSTPDAFSLDTLIDITPGTQVTSTAITVSGLNTTAVISVSAGDYAIYDGATVPANLSFTAANGVVSNGQHVIVRLTASAVGGNTVSSVLSIGGVSSVFSVKSLFIPDTTPDAFTIAPIIDSPLNTQVTSQAFTVTGINAATNISITSGNGQFDINGDNVFISSGTVLNNQSVRVRLTSAATVNTQTSVILNIGGVSANFSVTTLPEFLVTASAGLNGSISPASAIVLKNDTASFTVTPDPGYRILDVTGCGVTANGNVYTTAQIVANCTVSASFILIVNYSVGGNITGLVGNGLQLSLSNGSTSQSYTINAPNSTFSFPTTLLAGENYTASIQTQPTKPSQSCSLSGNTGVVDANSNSAITVNCAFNWVNVNPPLYARKLISPKWNGSELVTIDQSKAAILTGVLNQGSLVWSKYVPRGGLSSVVWTGTQWITVGSSGQIYTSPDALTWTEQNSGSTSNLSSVIWSGSLFVVVGDSGTILTSADAISWTAQSSGSTETLRDVHWNNTQYLAVGTNGTVLTSNNAVSWTVQTTGLTDDFSKIAWTGQRYVVGSYNSSTLRNSLDGTAWSAPAPSIGPVTDILWTGSLLVAVGWNGVVTSPDGTSWTQRSTTTSLTSLSWNGSQYVTVTLSGGVLTSPDAVTWTANVQRITTSGLYGLVWANNQFYAVGDYGTILSSLDGASWDRVSATEHIREVATDGTHWVASGENGSLVTSTDAINWTPTLSNTYNTLWSVVATRNPLLPNVQFVAVGALGTILTSADGVTWTSQNSTTTQMLWGVAWAGNMLVAVGEGGTIITSVDGVNWIAGTSGTTESLRTVGGNGTQWVAASSVGSILTGTPSSVDPSGVEWVVNSTISTGIFYGVTWFNGYWLAGAYPSNSNTFISTDGLVWNPVAQTAGSGYNYRFWWVGNQWLSVGITGNMITSVDGDNWIAVSKLDVPFSGNWIDGLAWNGDELIAYGFGGLIYITQ